ncbi:uroporphyrinogen-III synthase [Saccharospirillum mangrovi]|uniref:uroporphyrinogen-III synthase n=1 Tax=Saccharospirillum mangrovi TaxID=2161747 RepID=UPI000D39C54D|nr:uroporphyrinogen-III synthase [Saccharospirillum mangrovi]
MRLLLPKPEPDWARWRDGLAGVGVEPILIDPWQLEWLDETPAQRSLWLELDQFSGVICVSRRAAEALVSALDRYWPMPPARLHWLCNGPATASVLAAADLPVQFPESDNTAEAVLALPQTRDVALQKWLIVKGEGGRSVFAQTLQQRSAEVTETAVYRRALRAEALADLSRQRDQADAILVSSLTLAQGLVQQDAGWQDWPGRWLFSSPRLLDWARDVGIEGENTGGAALNAVTHHLR